MLVGAADGGVRVVTPPAQLRGEELGELAQVGQDLGGRPLAVGRPADAGRVDEGGLGQELGVEPGVLGPDLGGGAHPGAALVHGLSSTQRLRSVPMPSMVVSTVWPVRSHTLGVRPAPTPEGVPVAMRSPGRSVVNREMYDTRAAGPKSRSE